MEVAYEYLLGLCLSGHSLCPGLDSAIWEVAEESASIASELVLCPKGQFLSTWQDIQQETDETAFANGYEEPVEA